MDNNIESFSDSYSVTKLSNAIKFLVEEKFHNIKVKGEISGFKYAPSGHAYFSLKDDTSLLSCVCWRGSMLKLKVKPEEGLEVICSGSITTYAGQSKYQLVVTSFEHAGIGALMTLLAKRKEMFEKEGLFSPDLKKKIPYLPKTIGIITSPTGAVIRDILHRLEDRMPTHVLLWPTLVQGEQAAEQIAKAIIGFNNLDDFHKPNVIIVARGGGSLEDLWAFNEEIVVRAVAASKIPIISAVGHETDTTLIDYVSDLRAPTPTAATELTVPVRVEIILRLQDIERRIIQDFNKNLLFRNQILLTYIKSIPNLFNVILNHEQKIDDFAYRIDTNISRFIEHKNLKLSHYNIRHPRNIIEGHLKNIDSIAKNISILVINCLEKYQYELKSHMSNLQLQNLNFKILNFINQITIIDDKIKSNQQNYFNIREEKIKNISLLIESYSYHKTLARGYAIVRNENGELIDSKDKLSNVNLFDIEFTDGVKRVYSNS